MSWDRTQCLLKSRLRQPWGGAEDLGQQETVSRTWAGGQELILPALLPLEMLKSQPETPSVDMVALVGRGNS